MERIKAAQAARYEPSLTSVQTSRPPDMPSKEEWTSLSEQRNIPGFLLLDAVRFYKRSQTEQAKLTPVADALREDVRRAQRDIITLQQEQQDTQKRLGRAEAHVEGITRDHDRLEQNVDTARRDILRTTTSTSQNVQQIDEHAVELEAQRQELSILRNRLEQVESLMAQGGRPQGPASQMSYAVTAQSDPTLVMLPIQQTSSVRPVVRTTLPTSRVAKSPGKPSVGQHRRIGRSSVTKTDNPKLCKGRQISSHGKAYKQTAIPSDGEVTASEASYQQDSPGLDHLRDAEDASRTREGSPSIASDNGLSVITNGTAAGSTRAYLTNLFIEAQQRYTLKAPMGLRAHHQLIWKFLDSISDKGLSKRFQLFLLEHQEPGSVANGPWSASYKRQLVKRHRFIKLVDIRWPQFMQIFRDFLRLSYGPH